MESPKKSNKISEVVRLWQLLKKWRNFANSSKTAISAAATSPNCSGIHKSITFLKRTISSLSSDDKKGSNKKQHSSGNSNAVPKGYLAVCIGKELERFVIPTHYLGHPAFRFLLQEAKEEFGFQQTGVLRIPCDVLVFQSVVKMVEGKKKAAVNNGGLVAKEQCRLGANETCGGLLLDGGEMDRRHLHHSRHHPWSPVCR
ncbi:auxin-responsive protein SAUR72-like [Syzygium oleosum]|uniref:auxin-responsive protein SAUR72-like n=1 Tax=Syzygium oleosum TaxID=219896 RepID=UPI0024BA29F7|nr:auxin-responsive protein SAUR72-like [Syzygium oleosum]